MEIRSAQEALFVACEMESGAVQLYERTLCLMENRKSEPLYESLRMMLADEQRHLLQFKSLSFGLDEPMERQLILSAVASGLLFEGGLMGAVRAGLLSNVESMLRQAQWQESKAVETYRRFAAQSRDEQASAMLMAISEEEGRHLEEIIQQVSALSK